MGIKPLAASLLLLDTEAFFFVSHGWMLVWSSNLFHSEPDSTILSVIRPSFVNLQILLEEQLHKIQTILGTSKFDEA